MTDQSAQEPTMEEILASIRRIISEDDAPAEAAAPAETPSEPEPASSAPAPEPEPEPEPAVETAAPYMEDSQAAPEAPADDDDVLELTDRYETPAEPETIGDLDVAPAPAFELEPEPMSVSESEPVRAAPAPSVDTLVGAAAAASAASAFAGLTAASRQPADGRSLEDLVRDLLRPMLKEWLDANLPGIVEREVRKEVERISRQGGA